MNKTEQKKLAKNAPKVYSNEASGISDVIKKNLTDTTFIKISDFYKGKGLKTAIKEVKIGNEEAKPIRQALLNHIEEIEAFINNISGLHLQTTSTYKLPDEQASYQSLKWVNKDDYKGLLDYFEQGRISVRPSSERSVKTQEEVEELKELLKQSGQGDINIKQNSSKSGEGEIFDFKGLKIKDLEGLQEAIKKQIKPVKQYAIIEPSNDQTVKIDIDKVLAEIVKLNEKIGIEPSGGVFTIKSVNNNTGQTTITYGGKIPTSQEGITHTVIRGSHIIVRNLIILSLVRIKERAEKNKVAKSRDVVNVADSDNHDILLEPTAKGLLELFTVTASQEAEAQGVNKKDIKTFLTKFRTIEQQQAENGLAIYTESQQALPEVFTVENDAKTAQKVIGFFITQQVVTVVALWNYKKDHPDEDGFIKITDLAKYIPRFKQDMARGKGLRPEYRNYIFNGLRIAGLVAYPVTVKRLKGGGYQKRLIYLLDRVETYTEKNGTVTGVKVDFTDDYKGAFVLNRGVILDNLLEIHKSDSQLLGLYVAEQFLRFQDKTTRGEPLTCRADTLLFRANITDKHKTNRYKTLENMLNDLQVAGMIKDWHTKQGKGEQTIRLLYPESLTILIYPPTSTTNAYITKKQSKALRESRRVEQQKRHKVLMRCAKGYEKFDRLAEDLGITKPMLDELIGKQTEIDEDLLDKIIELGGE